MSELRGAGVRTVSLIGEVTSAKSSEVVVL